MTYGPFSPGHTVTAAEHNEFVAAFDSEVTRAMGAEATLASADTALAARATALETFQAKVGDVLPVRSSTTVLRYIGASALLLPNALDGGSNLGVMGYVEGAGGGTAFSLDLGRVLEPGFVLRSVGLVVTGSNFATLPGPLSCQIISVNALTGAQATVDTFTDNPADVAALNSRRSIGHTLSSPVTVSSSYQYFLKVFNHVGGTDSAPTRRITYNMALLGVSG